MTLEEGQVDVTGSDLATSVITFLAPKPAPFGLMRVGGNRDGAYLVPKCMRGISACFSPGVANRKDFEDELLRRYGIRSHLLDASSDVVLFKTPLQDGRQSFRKEWLAPESSEGSISLNDWVGQSEPEGEKDLILQMDIEGAEYEVLLAASNSVLERFRVAVIEFHGLYRMILGTEIEREKLRATMNSLEKLFVSVHARANNCCLIGQIPGTDLRVPEVVEVTFLRKDQLSRPARLRNPKVPHPLDIPRNVPWRRPIYLSGKWREHSSLFLPAAKVWSDWFLFFVQSPSRLPMWLVDRAYVRIPAHRQRELARMLFWRSRK